MKVEESKVQAAQAVYNQFVLSIYDIWVLSISNQFFWQCPSSKMLELYNRHVSGNHLDIGVGTGYFLDRCKFPCRHPRLVLLDLNENSLEFTFRRIQRYQPVTKKANILEKIQFEGRKFDSIGLNFLLHCLPGSMLSKEIVFKNILPLLNPGGVIFGSTILSKQIKPNNVVAQYLINIYNKKGIFNNHEDNLEDLQIVLKNNFSKIKLDNIGCVALFSCET